MPNIQKKQKQSPFYSSIKVESGLFQDESIILNQTIEAVNNFHELFHVQRKNHKGGPPTHAQQDLCRAMIVFASAGLDMLVKHLLRQKLPKLIDTDNGAKTKFQEHVRSFVSKDADSINLVALALIDDSPKEVLLNGYISRMISESQQSFNQLQKASAVSGFSFDECVAKSDHLILKDAFRVRNEIIHEMDIKVKDASGTTRHRSRNVRSVQEFEEKTVALLNATKNFLNCYKKKFEAAGVSTKKQK